MSSILYTGGTFDLFHYGHMQFLKNCKRLSRRVIVSLNTDEFIEEYKGKKPFLSFEERKKSILMSGCADEVIENSGGSDSKPAILSVRPDIIAIGDDWCKRDYYKQMDFTQEWLDERKILLVYLPYTRDISTTDIIKRVKNS